MIYGLLLAVIPLLITIIVVWLLLKRYRARHLEAVERREETLEKHGDPSDIYYYYCRALQASRMQHDEMLLVAGRIPRATKQQKTAAAPSFGHSSCSSSTSQLLQDTCSVFTECVQASDTRQEDIIVIGLQPGIQRVQMEERILPDEQTACRCEACSIQERCCSEHSIKKSFRSFEQLTGYYNNNNINNAMP